MCDTIVFVTEISHNNNLNHDIKNRIGLNRLVQLEKSGTNHETGPIVKKSVKKSVKPCEPITVHLVEPIFLKKKKFVLLF